MKRISRREKKRIATTKARHGSNVFVRGGKKGAKIRWGNK